MDEIKKRLNELKNIYENHNQEDIKRFGSIDEKLSSIDNKLGNHLVHIAGDLSNLRNNVSWLTKFFWLIVGIFTSALVGAVIKLII